MKLIETALVMAMASLALGCRSNSDSAPSSPFPGTNEVAGWARRGEIRSFDANNLWEYIDGDAERYIQAGVERTLTADYRYRGQTDAVADIYVMGTAEGARKVMEFEPTEGRLRIGLGDEGQLHEQSLAFRKDRYFVRLVAYENAREIGKVLVELGRAIEEKLGQAGIQ